MIIQLTLTDNAVAGWQDHLDTVVNPQREAANMLPHTIETFFQEAEEMAGVQNYVKMQKRVKWDAMNKAGLTATDVMQFAQMDFQKQKK